MHANRRREEDVSRPCLRLIGEMLANLIKEVLIPRRRKGNAAREQRSLARVVS